MLELKQHFCLLDTNWAWAQAYFPCSRGYSRIIRSNTLTHAPIFYAHPASVSVELANALNQDYFHSLIYKKEKKLMKYVNIYLYFYVTKGDLSILWVHFPLKYIDFF
jgi:hypothetical protein